MEWFAAFVACVAFALSFGFNYGVDNQVVYNLGALHLLHPELFHNDWFVSQTTSYHPTFEYFSALLLWFNPDGWGFAIATTVFVTVFGLLTYGLCRLLAGKQALPGFLLLLSLAFTVRLRGVGTSYIIDYILQPSSLGSVAFIGAMVAFVGQRWFTSGVLLAIGGLFHANYLILGGIVFGVAHLMLGGDGLVRRGVRQLAVPSLALLVFVPTILKTAGGADVQVARDILFQVRSPHHFRPASYEIHFLPFIGWHLIGIGAAMGNSLVRGPWRNLVGLAAALAFTVWLGTAGATYFDSSFAAQLFAQRLAPHLDLLFQAMWAIATVGLVISPGRIKDYSLLSLCLTISGLCCMLMYAGNHRVEGLPKLLLLTVALILSAQLIYWASQARFLGVKLRTAISNRWETVAHGALLLMLGGLVVISAHQDLGMIRARSTLLAGRNPSEEALYAWVREHTEVDAIFLTPPRIEGMRFHMQRAIVVDWKAVPIVPNELIEWHSRLNDVTGRKVRSGRDLGGYDSLSQARLESLTRKYRLSYAVIARGQLRGLKGKPVYQNSRFAVLKL